MEVSIFERAATKRRALGRLMVAAALTALASPAAMAQLTSLNLDFNAPVAGTAGSTGFESVYGLDNNRVGSQTLVNLGVQYTVPLGGDHSLQIYGKINNLFDADPPLDPFIFLAPTETNAALYDVVGRSFQLGVRIKL